MCVCVHACVRTCVCVCVHLRAYVCVCVCMYVCACLRVYVCVLSVNVCFIVCIDGKVPQVVTEGSSS